MDNQKMGDYIAAKRRALQMTQSQLAERLFVTRQAVSKWESGHSVPDTQTLLAMAELFGVKVETILHGEEEPPKAPPVPPSGTSGYTPYLDPAFYNPPPLSPAQPEAAENPCQSEEPPHPVLRSRAWWLLGLPALLAALILVLIPLGETLVYSLTSFNVLDPPAFVGLQNYVRMLSEPLTWSSLFNTLWILLTAGGIPLLLGALFGITAARLPLPIGVAAGGLFTVGSLCALTPSWLALLFSGDAYGLLNAWRIEAAQKQLPADANGLLAEPRQWLQTDANGIQILQLGLLCLASAYFIFYMGARCGRTRAAWHIGVTAMPAILLANWILPVSLTGFPSTDYTAHWLPSMVYDYGNIRFEAGFASALLILCLLVTAAVAAVGHLLVWLGALLLGEMRKKAPRRESALAQPLYWCGGSLGLACGLTMLFPLFLIVSWAVRPISEVFLFPPPLFPQQPTTENFSFIENAWGASLALYSGPPVYLLVSLALYLLLVLPTAAAMAFLPGKAKRTASAVWLAVMAAAPLFTFTYFWCFNFAADSRLTASLLHYCSSPLLPLNVLLTVWILRKSMAGCPNFSIWFQHPKRLVLTAATLLATGLASSLSLLFTASSNLMYDETKMFPLQIMASLLSGGIARVNTTNAAYLILLAIGGVLILLAAGLLIALYLAARKAPAGDAHS